MKRIKLMESEAVYHCIARIVGGEILLGDREKERLRRLMWAVAEFSGIEIVTYCLMGNHIHILVRAPESVELTDEEICRRLVKYYGRREPWVQVVVKGVKQHGVMAADTRKRLLARMGDVSVFMRTLKQRFSRWYNRTHKRFGTLWAERFKSVLVEDRSEVLRTVAMYIDLNPVRAGLVQDPKDYRFCGHAEALAGNRSARKAAIDVCGPANWKKAVAEYRSIMMVYAGDAGKANKVALSRAQIARVLRKGGQVEMAELLRLRLRYLTDGVVLGSPEFVEEVFEEFRDRFGPRRTAGAKKLRKVGKSLGGLATLRDLQKDAVG